jgi:hypothetical protein
MAKKKAKNKGGRPPSGGTKPMIFQMRGDEDEKTFLHEVRILDRQKTTTSMVRRAVVHYAEFLGYDGEIPFM